MAKRILIIEDDRDLSNLVEIHVNDIGFQLDKAFDGETGLQMAEKDKYELVILDIMLPGMEGFEVCRKIRETNKSLPILMLTARSEELDKVLGLELGADDYITKPFSIRELMARIKTNIRRVDAVREESEPRDTSIPLVFDELTIDLEKRKVKLGDKLIELTAKEFDVLALFASHPGRSYTREQLLNEVWGYHFDGYDHTVNLHINRLRSKIEQDPSHPKYIKTVWGVGYRFVDYEEIEI